MIDFTWNRVHSLGSRQYHILYTYRELHYSRSRWFLHYAFLEHDVSDFGYTKITKIISKVGFHWKLYCLMWTSVLCIYVYYFCINRTAAYPNTISVFICTSESSETSYNRSSAFPRISFQAFTFVHDRTIIVRIITKNKTNKRLLLAFLICIVSA